MSKLVISAQMCIKYHSDGSGLAAKCQYENQHQYISCFLSSIPQIQLLLYLRSSDAKAAKRQLCQKRDNDNNRMLLACIIYSSNTFASNQLNPQAIQEYHFVGKILYTPRRCKGAVCNFSLDRNAKNIQNYMIRGV